MDYLNGLNERQKEAVLATEGPVSVLAGAGSGKTRVLTTRVYHLIRSGVLPERILAVTFTNKAAREMRERLSKRLGETVSVWKKEGIPFIATFHGLGRELLEQYGSAVGVPRHFSIFDRDDSKKIIKKLLQEVGIDPKELSPGAVLSHISKAKGDGKNSEEYKKDARSFFARVTADIWPRYQEALSKEKALDFDDLLTLPVTLLEEHADVREKVRERFHYIHVDEYQDVNNVQARLTELLSEPRTNLFVVSDPDQTIYTWRGAHMEHVMRFETTYPNAKLIVLDHNYRSTKTIVEASNQVIEKNTVRKDKHSVTDNDHGQKIQVHAAASGMEEAYFIARETKKLLGEGVPPQEIAVLYRTNFQSRGLEEAFLREGVPYRLIGTQYLDRKEVKDVLAWVRLAVDPSREADFVRAVQTPSRGIGKVTLGKIVAGKKEELRAGDRAKVEAFEYIVRKLHEAAQIMAPSAFVRLVIESSGLRTALEKGGEDDLERLENAMELATLATRYDETPGIEGIAAFLADTALAGDQDEIDRPTRKGKKDIDAASLMTVHAAKGLEFDVVFVTGLEEGLFPHEGSGDDDRDEEEERRLFYVAMTRAKKILYLTLARVRKIYGTDYLQEPSSFLNDIDGSLVEYKEADHEPNIYI